MTHIVVGNGYLIADKRTSFVSGSGGAGDGKTPGSKRANFLRDDGVKITIPHTDMVYGETRNNAEHNRVVALAMTGSHRDSRIHPVELAKQFNNLSKFVELLNKDAFTADNFSLVAVLENGDAVVVRQDLHPTAKARWYATVFTAKFFEDKHFKAAGSGGFMHKVLEPLYKQGAITLLEAFLYGSHLDPHSSMRYSVFGLKENRLFTTVIPTPEEQQAAVEKVHALLAFKEPKRTYLPPQIN